MAKTKEGWGAKHQSRPPKLCTSGLTSAAAPSTYGVDYIEGMGKQGVYGVGIFTLPVTVALLLRLTAGAVHAGTPVTPGAP